MPSKKALGVIVNNGKLTDENLVEMIESRQSLMRQFLDRYTLTELRELDLLKDESSTWGAKHRLSNYEKVFSENGQSEILKTRCIVVSKVFLQSLKKKKILAIIRSGEFVLFSIDYIVEEWKESHDVMTEKPTNISMEVIGEDGLLDILKSLSINPLEIFKKMGKIVLGLYKHQKEFFDDISNAARMIEIEDLALSQKR